jgi:hypothetical protein
MNFSRNYIVVAIISLTGCHGFDVPDEKQPLSEEFRYDLKRSLVYDPPQREYRTVFKGVRCFTPHGSPNSTDHDFLFDNDGPVDQLIVSITDAYGLNPGDSYDYVLQQLPLPQNGGNGKTLQTWPIKLENKNTATEKLHRFEFIIDLAGSQGLVWNSAQKVAGQYELGSTTRDTVVDLEFRVGNKVSADAFCAYKD